MNNSLMTHNFDSNSKAIMSIHFLRIARKINFFVLAVTIGFGFVGNLLITLVYSRKKFRSNSTHIYLLCLSICDNFTLIIHFFEVVNDFKTTYIRYHTLKYI